MSSFAFSDSRNISRTIAAVEQATNKLIGRKVDMVYL